MLKERPKSVTVVSWIIIVFGGLALWGIPRTIAIYKLPEYQALIQSSGDSLGRVIAMLILQSTIYFVAGIAMLKGFNWGRWLYIFGTGGAVLFSIVTRGFSLFALPSIVVYIVLLILLVRRPAAEFFSA